MKEKHEMVFGERLREVRERKNLTQSELAEILGYKNYTTISKWESGDSLPRGKELKTLAELFNVTTDFLLGIEKKEKLSVITKTVNVMKKLHPPRQEKVYTYAEEQLHEQESTIEENNICYLPTVDNSAAAANPTELAYGDTTIEYQQFVNVPAGANFAVPIHGNSMEPTIQDGDYVFVKTQSHIENGEIALVEIDGDGVTCKKVYFNPEDGRIILHSLNAEYDDRELDPERVRIIGKVLL